MGKKYSEENILRRIMSIPKIHDAIKNKEDLSKFSNIDKITYILWRDGYTRNSDIALSIEFYKQFHSEYIQDDDAIKLEDLYNIPKMYDIQRTRADIQNTQGLFPATEEVQQMRQKEPKNAVNIIGNKNEKLLEVYLIIICIWMKAGKMLLILS